VIPVRIAQRELHRPGVRIPVRLLVEPRHQGSRARQRTVEIVDTRTNTGCPVTDPRGVARPQGPTCDIGAVEVQADVISADGFEPGWRGMSQRMSGAISIGALQTEGGSEEPSMQRSWA
jgi:hypothetical protein